MENGKTPPGFAKEIWRFFASVKLTVVLLLSLAATSIIGTLIPQNERPAAYIRAYGEKLYRVFDLLQLFDMYHSWWFQLLLILLTANVIVCSLDRIPTAWKIVFVKRPPFNPGRFRKDSDRIEFTTGQDVQQVRQIVEPMVGKKYGYYRMEATETGWCLLAEKGRWTRLGAYIVHISVIFLLVGGLIGSLVGFEGNVNIPEGESVSQIFLRNSGEPHQLEFAIRCDDFDVSFYESGSPKEYRSTLTLLEQGKEVLTRDIVVNDPLRYKGINIFQSSYGSVPSDMVTVGFVSQESGMSYTRKVKVGESVDVPEAHGTFRLERFSRDAQFRGHHIGEAYVGKMIPSDGEPVEVILPVRFPSFDKMRKGKFVVSVEGYDEKFYTGLQVTHDPGVPLVYTGFILMILGCIVTFFISHQRIFVEAAGGKDITVVIVAGSANKNKLGVRRKVEMLAKKIEKTP